MTGGTKAIKTLGTAATVVSWLTLPAYPQGLGKMGGGYAGPPVETHAPVDEKAYKAALERVPAPDRKYDPWGLHARLSPQRPRRNETRDAMMRAPAAIAAFQSFSLRKKK
jgi:hypothetical protein